MPTVEAYKDFIRKHKEKNCPPHSNKKKEQLKRLAEKFGYEGKEQTKKVYTDYIKQHKKENCPSYSNKKKEQLKRLAERLGYEAKKAPKKVKTLTEKKQVKPPEKKEVKTQPPEPEKKVKTPEAKKQPEKKVKQPGEYTLHELNLLTDDIYREWRDASNQKVDTILKPLKGQKNKPGYEKKLSLAINKYNELRQSSFFDYDDLENKLDVYRDAVDKAGGDVDNVLASALKHIEKMDRRMKSYKKLTPAQMKIQGK